MPNPKSGVVTCEQFSLKKYILVTLNNNMVCI